MSKKAKNCHECRHWRSGSFGEPDCAKGHKPRFYLPQTMRDAITDGFGYKRRCADFEEVETK